MEKQEQEQTTVLTEKSGDKEKVIKDRRQATKSGRAEQVHK